MGGKETYEVRRLPKYSQVLTFSFVDDDKTCVVSQD